MKEEHQGFRWQEGRWLIQLFLISLIMAIALKTIALTYPLPNTVPVVWACITLPALLTGIFLIYSSKRHNN
ncbi:hypothetical protein L3556_09255 [Candidatus Synechococcus calcipolaris G9]|uniref:Uncharacterized protein n=1 Tax=Candidatus Synechococcus calcipolaris G9 TaxID=1497997 RepID=A0ABT6EZW4_9SYNE|nr:hypothetical protein [Candidatus Synechococcus calcipolaris]MDG2991111.1 hypothetical protein [Candidatus Synechococcus calcipolaris G9]